MFGKQLTQKIFASYKTNQTDWRRPHLGASIIGHPCQRYIWYSFRWAKDPNFSGRMLRLFETGNLAESRFISDLESVGVTVSDQQLSFQIGHFGGSIDGIGIGFPHAPAIRHLLEFKTMSDSQFKKLAKSGVKLTKPQHYGQMQVYMSEFDLKAACYMAVNKNTDDIYCEFVECNDLYATKLFSNAHVISIANEPPEPTKCPECFFCPYQRLCSETDSDVPERNCRTCKYAEPTYSGNWQCNEYKIPLKLSDQKSVCSDYTPMECFVK